MAARCRARYNRPAGGAPMGIRDWFRKADRNPPPAEVSPGGSRFIHHEGGQAGPAMPAFSTLPYIERREAVYRRLFGPAAAVDDDQFPGMIPHIDVYRSEEHTSELQSQ